MPEFIYRAKENPKKVVEGTVEADNIDSAVKKVIGLGYSPLEVVPKKARRSSKKTKAPASIKFSLKRIPLSSIVLFTRQLSDLVDAAVPLIRALSIVKNQTRNQNLQNIIEEIYVSVRDGGSFSVSLNQYPKVFPKLYVNMVEAGQSSGKLNVVLSRLAILLEKEQETKNKVISSLAYPAIILGVGIIGVLVFLMVVIPQMTVFFEDFDQALPLPTIIFINISNVFSRYWWVFMGAVAFLIFYFKRVLSTPKGILSFDQLKLKTPFLKDFIRDIEIGRFSRILGTLLESGVPIVSALKSVQAVLENTVLKEEIKRVSEEVTKGSSLNAALKECKYFPEMALNMIAVGEETGYLEQGLYKLADAYERESERTVKTFLNILGPMILIVIVSILGFIVVSLFLPILNMNLIIS